MKNQIINDLKALISKHYNVSDLVLFGSQARNQATQDSDYDILILLEKEYTWKDKRNIHDLCYEIVLKYNVLIDPHILSKAELTTLRGLQPIYVNAIKNGIHA